MIALFAKRGWFWELLAWLALIELARVIGG
jgi:hypothetical protein